MHYIRFTPSERQLYEFCKKDSAMLIEHSLAENTSSRTYSGILQCILRLRLLCNHGKELLSTEVSSRLQEYTKMDSPATVDSEADSSAALSVPNMLNASCVVECDLCNDSIDTTETETAFFTGCSHSICNRCSMLYEPYPIQPQGVESFCPICTEVDENPSPVTEQLNQGWMDGMTNNGPSSKVKALIGNLQDYQKESRGEPAKRYFYLLLFSKAYPVIDFWCQHCLLLLDQNARFDWTRFGLGEHGVCTV